jgi:hypothetical protein
MIARSVDNAIGVLTTGPDLPSSMLSELIAFW